MGNSSPTGPAVAPDPPQSATPGSSTFTAQNGSIVNAPQFTGVHATRDANLTVTVNNTYVQSAGRTDDTNSVPSRFQENIQRCQEKLKSYLQQTTKNLFQGTKDAGSSTPLKKIYTELYITEGGSGEVNSEHEVTELECSKCTNEERKIHLNDIFTPLSNEEDPPQRVLTKGIAGIRKTVAVQKFTHDWAEGTANQTIQFIFPFTFRELNKIHKKDKCWSLTTLIRYYFEEVKDLEESDYNSSSVLFIFDGLDESKLPLDFEKNEMCRSVTKTTTVDALLTNLIKGRLLCKASVWITSRPAAASKIPYEFINRVTEVRGFNDEQKEEYFQKKISDKDVAQKILNHLQSKPLRSLYIMCHIPVFCWISATVFQSLFTECQDSELPKSVTEMYTHFIIIQIRKNREKDYQDLQPDKDLIMKLGKLAFEQLKDNNIIFNENDLKDCNIDLKQVAVYSGVCTQIIRKEYGLHRRESYSFIHLSVQEFLAALYVLETFIDRGKNLLTSQRSVKVASEKGNIPIVLLHKNAVDMALASQHGQWDLFLRFLLGLSQDKNQNLLQKVSGFKGRCLQDNRGIIEYVNNMIKKASFYEKNIYLFHCLNELGDQSLVELVQRYQSSGDFGKFSPAHWSALAYVLLVSDDDLAVFDLKKFSRSEEVLERLLPVLKVSKKALLSDCNLTDRCCKSISSVLSLKSSGLEELDLSRNNLQDSGMELLSDGLKDPNCKLQRLSLNNCSITRKGCLSLASGLMPNPSHLRELDLSKNNIFDGAVKDRGCLNLTPALDHQLGLHPLSEILNKCSLETLRLSECGITEKDLKSLTSSLSLNPSHLKNLDLSRNSFGHQACSLLSDFLKHPDCQLERLWSCTESSCETLAAVLRSNPSHLRELELSNSNPGESGLQNGQKDKTANGTKSNVSMTKPYYIPRKDIVKELQEIDNNLNELEKREVELKMRLRKNEEEGECDSLMVEWFSLIRNKQVAMRRESELVYIGRTQDLEGEQPSVEQELRRLMEKPDRLKTAADRKREEDLLHKMMDSVNDRNAIIEGLSEDRLREQEEDEELNKMMMNFNIKIDKPKKKSPMGKLFGWGNKKEG